MLGLTAVIDLIQRGRMRGKIWIDGSFVTEKLNPDDADLILVIEESVRRQMDQQQIDFIQMFSETSFYDQYKCDNYVLVKDGSIESEYIYAYWLRQFGFSRGDQMKGLAVISVPFLVVT